MDVNKYINSDEYAAVIETDRAVMINGVFIPCVLQGGVKCSDSREGIHEVTLSFMTDTFIRLSGKPSKDFEEEHGYKPEYSFDRGQNTQRSEELLEYDD